MNFISRPPPPDFDDAAYLAANPDVQIAVRVGGFRSGWQHYQKFGRAEARPLAPRAPSLSRREKLFAGLDPAHMVGVEIGALTAPLV